MNENKKYELTEEVKEYFNKKCIIHRIKALKDFGNVKKGELGGFVESEDNLSQDGNCWIYDDAMVVDNARVSGNAEIFDDAEVYDYAQVYDDAKVYDNAEVFGYVTVSDNARVFDYAKVFENARVYDNAYIYGYTRICGDAEICGDADICGNAVIKSDKDYMTFKNNWRNARYFTWTKSNNMWRDNTFYGTGDELVNQAYEDDEESGRKYEIIVDAVNKINSI